jgi:beta-glucosidase-like glycosyl hydrolase/CubicO group peptidase (beta-lactamase class C family)
MAESVWVDSVLQTLTLEQKVGQMVMVGTFGYYFSEQSDEFDRLAQQVQDRHVGGVILRQGDVYESAILLNRLQELSKVPLLVAADYERGLAMRVRRGTAFPDAMAIGATRNPHYAYEVGLAIAREARAIGVHQNYAPVADININPLNPVINTRAFGDDPELVRSMVRAFVRGTQDGGILATVKHFPGHGETGTDSHLELPVVRSSRERLDSLELSAFRAAIDQGVGAVMTAHIGYPQLDPGPIVPGTLSPVIVTSLLRRELAYGGLIVTDAMEMRGVTRDYSVTQATLRAVKAGVDLVLIPPDEETAVNSIVSAVRLRELPAARIDSSVRRILAVKYRMGLDTTRTVSLARIPEVVAGRNHRQLAREVAYHAMTIVKNEGNILPLKHFGRQRVASIVISDVAEARQEVNRNGNPWPCEPVGAYMHKLLDRHVGRLLTARLDPASNSAEVDGAIRLAQESDVVVLSVFVKVRTSSGRIGLPAELTPFFSRLEQTGKPVVVVVLGTPYVAANFPRARAIVCAYGDSEPLMEAGAAAVFGETPACGKLPVTIPGAFTYGAGMLCPDGRLLRADPTDAGFDAARFLKVDEIIQGAIRDSAFPAAQLAVVKNGYLVALRAFGTYTYASDQRPIDTQTIFDLASISKVIGTTSAVMKLMDEGRLTLYDTLGRFLPEASAGRKGSITIRHLLTHRAGYPPFKRFFLMCRTSEEALDSVFACQLVAQPGDTTIYSDIGMITLGKIVERITGMSQAEFLKREFFEPLGMGRTMYNPPRRLFPQIAPTEVDTVWRMSLVRGQVHDENAALLGGVAGHAGLFSCAGDLAVFMQMLMNGGTYAGVRYLSDSIVSLFTRTVMPGEPRYLGWDRKSPAGSSAGSMFSPASFGHTGFTGTSIWADPDRKLVVILLTNRVHPTRANLKIAGVRPMVHDAVVEALR